MIYITGDKHPDIDGIKKINVLDWLFEKRD